jgi:quercetin dioxygenase-like cupin family protein
MAISHATPGHPFCVLPSASDETVWQSTALFKTESLEVMRLILTKGKTMPMHKVAGEITIHCLSGVISLVVETQPHILIAGHMVYLGGSVLHGLTAMEDACALVHIVLNKP